MTHEEFVVQFMEDNKKTINRCTSKRLIANRYSKEDMRSYISERILDILQKRKAKGRPIEDPAIYFRKLIDYYCIEFQRMHGYIYGMPKRPRAPEAEAEIAQYGFVYFPSNTDGEGGGKLDHMSQLGYIDAAITDPKCYGGEFPVKGLDPGVDSESWEAIMNMALPEDQEVLTCIFKYNMSVPEASRHLGISISTAYQRKERGLTAISGTLATFIDLDQINWRILSEVKGLDRDETDITRLYRNRAKSLKSPLEVTA